jgi:hypothetical protein
MTNQDIKNITSESLRDWFKKEKWVRISTSGDIAGPCGTSKNKKNPDRCLPKAKAQSLSKAERAATARKKKKAGAKGKTVVANTKKAKVTREMKEQWPQEIESRHGDYIFKLIKTGSDRAKYAVIDKETGEQKGTPLFNTVDNLKAFASDYIKSKGGRQSSHFGTSETANPQDGKAAPYGSGYKKATVMKKNIAERLRFLSPEKQKANDAAFDRRMATLKDLEKGIKLHKAGKISDEELHNLKLKAGTISADSKFTEKNETKEAPAGHYFTKSGNLVKGRMSADAKERGARKSDPKDKMRSKVPPVSQTREDITNLVVGTLHEMQNEGKSHTIDLGNIKSDDLWMIASHLKDATINGKTGPISDLISQAADMLEDSETESLNEKDDRCTRLAKQKYDTWPSAYASGAVVRCRRGEIWKKK